MENRLRIYGEDYPWHKLHRERDQKIFEGEKIVTPNRAPQNTFGLSNVPMYAMSDVFFITSSNRNEKLPYILALLNSVLIDFWFSRTKKGKGQTREYVGTPLSQIPIRRINFADPQEVKIYDHLVKLVDSIIEAKKNLASYNQFFPKVRLTRLQENEPLPKISGEEVVKSLESSVLRTIRTHPQIRYQPQTIEHFFLKGAKLAEDTQSLTVVSKDK